MNVDELIAELDWTNKAYSKAIATKQHAAVSRVEAVRKAHKGGLSFTQIAGVLNVTTERVRQLYHGRD